MDTKLNPHHRSGPIPSDQRPRRVKASTNVYTYNQAKVDVLITRIVHASNVTGTPNPDVALAAGNPGR